MTQRHVPAILYILTAASTALWLLTRLLGR
jgi:hypothetical protein